MKVCSTCKILRDDFYPNRTCPDGLQTYCIECSKERSKERYKNFSDEQKKKMRDRSKEQARINKQFVWDYLKEHPCIDCGETDPIVLEFDHFKEKTNNISSMCNQAVSVNRIKKEIEKCEVRCAHCHRRKTAKQFGWYKDIVL